jgi:hypothetical protein
LESSLASGQNGLLTLELQHEPRRHHMKKASKAASKTASTPASLISKITTNRMGTTDFEGQFAGMRKPQEFTVYPIHAGGDATRIKVQSNTRIGFIDMESGHVKLSPAYPGGAHNEALAHIGDVGKLSQEELFSLKAQVFSTASGKAGTNGIMTTDNSGATEVFGVVAAK